MDTYVIHAHGLENPCPGPIILDEEEYIMMHCTQGCTLHVYNLFNEFINKHLMKVDSSDRFLFLMRNPESVGKKYEKLKKFLNSTFCIFKDIAPDLTIYLNSDTFIAGLYKLPVKGPPEQWPNMEAVFGDPSDGTTTLGIIVNNLRRSRLRSGSKPGFLLSLFTCREYYNDVPTGTPIGGS